MPGLTFSSPVIDQVPTRPVPHSILIIDDDVTLLQALGGSLEDAGWEVYRELSGEAGLATFARALPDVVLVGLALPGIDGLGVLARLRAESTSVVVLVPDASPGRALDAMRGGAEQVLVGPVDTDLLHHVAGRAAEKVRLRRVNRTLIERDASVGGLEVLGRSPMMAVLRERVVAVASSEEGAVLLRGEIGVGKRSVARLIHDLSSRANAAFIECFPAASEPQGLRARLFGVAGPLGGEEGGARPGLLDSADGGTLLLHHVELAPVALQQEVLEVLERGTFRRVDGLREVPVDVRLVATTGVDPAAEVEAGRLLPELYYRLGATEIAIPPLRDLPAEDLSRAVQRMLRRMGSALAGTPASVSDAALDRMLGHPWSGNYRELRHVLERALLQAPGRDEVGIEHLPGEFRARPGPFDRRHTPLTMEEVERMHIERTLRHHDGNRTRSAEELSISRATLIAKIKKYAIPL